MAKFKATNETAPKYEGKDYVNSGLEILSAEMILRLRSWIEASDFIISAKKKAINSKK